jgi:hypothetical protein
MIGVVLLRGESWLTADELWRLFKHRLHAFIPVRFRKFSTTLPLLPVPHL